MSLRWFCKGGKRFVMRRRLLKSLVYVWKEKSGERRAEVGILVQDRNGDIDSVRFLKRNGGCESLPGVLSVSISREIVSIVREGNVIKGIVLLYYGAGVSSSVVRFAFYSYGLSEGKVVVVISKRKVRVFRLKRMARIYDNIDYEEVRLVRKGFLEEGGKLCERLLKCWRELVELQVV